MSMEWIVGFLALVGLSASFWAFVGIARYIQEKYMSRMGPRNAADRILPAEVAVMVPAYNEELCIEKTLKSLFKIVPKKNVYVGSDSSSDRTFEIAKKQGCNVASIRPMSTPFNDPISMERTIESETRSSDRNTVDLVVFEKSFQRKGSVRELTGQRRHTVTVQLRGGQWKLTRFNEEMLR